MLTAPRWRAGKAVRPNPSPGYVRGFGQVASGQQVIELVERDLEYAGEPRTYPGLGSVSPLSQRATVERSMLNRSASCSWLKPTALRRAAMRWRFAGTIRSPISGASSLP